MGSETMPLSLPVIDFYNAAHLLKPSSLGWKSLVDQVGKALQEYGCFEALFDKIPMKLRRSVFGALEEFFDLPVETKMSNVSNKPFHGYINGQYEKLPLYESMGIEDVSTIEADETFASKMWPHQTNPDISVQYMESESMELRLPVIDFSNAADLMPSSLGRKSLVDQVGKALQEYGCFEALFDKIPMELRRFVFGALEEFFDLPVETKMSNVSNKPFHGYINGQYEKLPLYESMGNEDVSTIETVETFTSKMWPHQRNPDISQWIHSYSKHLLEFEQLVRVMILQSLGVEKYADELNNSSTSMLRVMKYTAVETNDTEVGLWPHTDKSFMTILYQNQIHGLQVQTKNGDWISCKPRPNSFIVMVGDYLHAWTNGRLYSTVHRVMMSGNETRYSTGFFCMPKECYIIAAPTELVDEEHPSLYNAFDHVEFLKFYESKAYQDTSAALKAFCGI